MAYAAELRIARLAVQRASLLTQRIFLRGDSSKQTILKPDQSPVTVADFGAQALIISALRHSFPNDKIVAEEEADDLRESPTLSQTVWDLVRNTFLDDTDGDTALGGPIRTETDMLDLIDGGKYLGGSTGRFWTIDPIDGTKGFVRGDQYAICLALIDNGKVVVGVLGCPNLPISDDVPLEFDVVNNLTEKDKGVLFSAVADQGANVEPLAGSGVSRSKIQVKSLTDTADARFCESFESSHSDHDEQGAIARKLGIKRPNVRMDSQAKYASLARGAGDIYLRLPLMNRKTGSEYPFLIWDHAAGNVIVQEAGGKITDATGKPLDFGRGRILTANRGVIAAPPSIHSAVLDAVRQVTGGKYEQE